MTGETPDISLFWFHFWELIEYYNPNEKQTHDGWKKGRFLDIAWDSGNNMTYKIELIQSPRQSPQILICSTIRSYNQIPASKHPEDSGETTDLNSNITRKDLDESSDE